MDEEYSASNKKWQAPGQYTVTTMVMDKIPGHDF
jgi:hypothetical protein